MTTSHRNYIVISHKTVWISCGKGQAPRQGIWASSFCTGSTLFASTMNHLWKNIRTNNYSHWIIYRSFADVQGPRTSFILVEPRSIGWLCQQIRLAEVAVSADMFCIRSLAALKTSVVSTTQPCNMPCNFIVSHSVSTFSIIYIRVGIRNKSPSLFRWNILHGDPITDPFLQYSNWASGL